MTRFIKNKYRIIYLQIINNALAQNRIRSKDYNADEYVYYENHHIFPRKIFPKLKNKIRNQVLLTGKEHF